MKKGNKQLGYGVVMSYLFLVCDTLISIIYTPILLNKLGDSQYGLYQLMGSMVNYLAIMDLGLGSTITRYMVKYRTENDRRQESNFLAIGLMVYGAISCIVLLGATGIYFSLDTIFASLTTSELKDAKVLFIILALNLTISLFDHAFSGVLSAYEEFVIEKGIKIARIVVRALVVIALLQCFSTALVIVLVEFSLTFIILITKIVLCIKRLDVKPHLYKLEFPLLREMFAFTAAILIQTIANQFNNNVDKTVLGIYSTTAAVATYSVAMQLFSAYSGISTAVQSVYFPRISSRVFQNEDDNEKITKSLIEPSRIQFIMLSAICIGFWLFGKEFVVLWCDKEEAWLIACLIMTAATLELFQNCTTAVLKAKNLLRGRTWISLGTAVGNFVITMLLVPHYGMLGAAAGTVFTMIVGYGVCNNLYYHYRVGIKLRYFFKRVLQGIVPAIIVSAVLGIGVAYIFPEGSWLWFLLKVAVFVVIYLFSMWLLGFNESEKKLIHKILVKVHLKKCA